MSKAADTSDTARYFGDTAATPAQESLLLRWWHQYQTQQLIDQADSIRNGVLQDVFALRRHLELLGQVGIENHGNTLESCVQEVEHIYRSLQSLSDRMSCPYLEESLPLSIQHGLQPWQAVLPLDVQLPGTWEPEPVEQVAMLLALLQKVLQGTASEPALPETLSVSLRHDASKTLTVRVGYPQAMPERLATLSESADMANLFKTFRLLSGGTVRIDQQPQTLTWDLQW